MRQPAPLPTTEEHVTTPGTFGTPGTPALLGAFPSPVFVPLPPSRAPIGRAWLAEHGVEDPKISGEHCSLWARGESFFVSDAGSRNGTFLDGHRLPLGEAVPLREGAVLRLGASLFVFRAVARTRVPEAPLGGLVAPWGLSDLRAALRALRGRASDNVLVVGETGTGKELVAREVAVAMGRDRRYAAINVAGISPTVFEGQLFGWVRGAFSGAAADSPGVLRAHAGGAVFLDEIGDLPLELQVKLLRVLENHEVLPVGGARAERVDVAIVAATNRDLASMVEKAEFRADLLARFARRVALPPLRDRAEDVYAVFSSLWRSRHSAARCDEAHVDVEAVEALLLHDWPANVRDVDRLARQTDPEEGLTPAVVERVLGIQPLAASPPTRDAIARAVEAHGGNRTAAARALGVSRGWLLRRLGEGAARS